MVRPLELLLEPWLLFLASLTSCNLDALMTSSSLDALGSCLASFVADARQSNRFKQSALSGSGSSSALATRSQSVVCVLSR